MTDNNHRVPSRNKPGRLCAALGVFVVLLGVGACGGKSGGSVKPDPKKAASELSAGLQAQSAGKLDAAASHYNEEAYSQASIELGQAISCERVSVQ